MRINIAFTKMEGCDNPWRLRVTGGRAGGCIRAGFYVFDMAVILFFLLIIILIQLCLYYYHYHYIFIIIIVINVVIVVVMNLFSPAGIY